MFGLFVFGFDVVSGGCDGTLCDSIILEQTGRLVWRYDNEYDVLDYEYRQSEKARQFNYEIRPD